MWQNCLYLAPGIPGWRSRGLRLRRDMRWPRRAGGRGDIGCRDRAVSGGGGLDCPGQPCGEHGGARGGWRPGAGALGRGAAGGRCGVVRVFVDDRGLWRPRRRLGGRGYAGGPRLRAGPAARSGGSGLGCDGGRPAGRPNPAGGNLRARPVGAGRYPGRAGQARHQSWASIRADTPGRYRGGCCGGDGASTSGRKGAEFRR